MCPFEARKGRDGLLLLLKAHDMLMTYSRQEILLKILLRYLKQKLADQAPMYDR